eukprot:919556-Rhodomonas_salina.1
MQSVGQYCAWHSIIRWISTTHPGGQCRALHSAVYSKALPIDQYRASHRQYRASRSTVRNIATTSTHLLNKHCTYRNITRGEYRAWRRGGRRLHLQAVATVAEERAEDTHHDRAVACTCTETSRQHVMLRCVGIGHIRGCSGHVSIGRIAYKRRNM